MMEETLRQTFLEFRHSLAEESEKLRSTPEGTPVFAFSEETMMKHWMAVKKVEFPSFNGEDLAACRDVF